MKLSNNKFYISSSMDTANYSRVVNICEDDTRRKVNRELWLPIIDTLGFVKQGIYFQSLSRGRDEEA